MENKRPVCPECGKRSVVLFSPPREGIVGTQEGYDTIGMPEYVDWNRAHLYCANGTTNCKYEALLSELTTPLPAPKEKETPNEEQ